MTHRAYARPGASHRNHSPLMPTSGFAMHPASNTTYQILNRPFPDRPDASRPSVPAQAAAQGDSSPERRQVGEFAFAWILLAFSLAIGYLAYQISGLSSINSAGAFPLGVSLIMLLSSLWSLVEAMRKQPAATRGWMNAVRQFCHEHFPQPVLVFLGLAVLYLVTIQWATFYVSTFVFLASSILYLRRGGVLLALGVSAGSVLLVYLLFTLVFSVYLP